MTQKPFGAASVQSTAALFYQAADRFDGNVAMRWRDATRQAWIDIEWGELRRRVDAISAALLDLGVKPGDCVAILAASRVEWAVVDLANFAIGAVTVPIYHSNMPDDVRYVLDHAEARVVFVEDREQLGKVLEVRGSLPGLEHAVLVEGKVQSPGFVQGFDKLIERGRAICADNPGRVKSCTDKVRPEDLATIVYTSGTTGRPKGVMLSHANLLFEIDAGSRAVIVDEHDETLLFLPMAHIFARLGYLLFLETGYTISFAESIERLMDNLGEIKPTFVFSVPRIYEKVHSAVQSGVQQGGRLKRQIFAYAMAVGRSVSRRRQRGQWIPPHLNIAMQVAEMLVFNKLKHRFGGHLRFFISGGAPLAPEIAEFFHAAGILVLEGYGLTENVGAACVNLPDRFRFGTVGRPIDGVEVRVADDGELLLRGGNVFGGYYKRDEATRESIIEGWFHTGDIGEIDGDGFVRITDRKKELIVTSGGKNIAPQRIENIMKTCPMVSQVMVYGDKRNYLTALVTLDPTEMQHYADRREVEYEEIDELYAHPVVRSKVEREFEKRNKQLASFETIKKFAILDRDFEIGEELTPTLKVKRKLTTERYWNILDGMYASGPSASSGSKGGAG